MATDEGIVCMTALSALIDGVEVEDGDLTILQWQAADRIHAAIGSPPADAEDRVLKMALASAIGEPLPTLPPADRDLAVRMVAEHKRSVGA